MSAKSFIWVILFLLTIHNQGFPKDLPPVDGIIHEAFAPPVQGAVILEAVEAAPPERITEKVPLPPSPQEEWIPGYWAYDKKKSAFTWVCGVWRKTPPGMVWNPGYWKQFDEGWVWLRGFWHREPAQSIGFIEKAPPATIHENPGPSPAQNAFWAAGFWEYQESTNSFLWRSGRFEAMDPDWVFTPATYAWRPEGYVFLPAYWDWPLRERGAAYCTILLNPDDRWGVVNTPTVVMEPEAIIRNLYGSWPDHILVIHHCWTLYPDMWSDFCCPPPWWGWSSWWWLDWFLAWDLWWWWGHPGFPYPSWLSANSAELIPPPPSDLLPLLRHLSPPPIVGGSGMLPPDELLDAIEDATGHSRPILPADPMEREEIANRATLPFTERETLRPKGKPNGAEPTPPEIKTKEIDFGPSIEMIRPPIRASLLPPVRRRESSSPEESPGRLRPRFEPFEMGPGQPRHLIRPKWLRPANSPQTAPKDDVQ